MRSPRSPTTELLAFGIDTRLAAADVSRILGDDIAPLAVARSMIALRLEIR